MDKILVLIYILGPGYPCIKLFHKLPNGKRLILSLGAGQRLTKMDREIGEFVTLTALKKRVLKVHFAGLFDDKL